ncbi:TetR/AcrR family transcriptional regulator [Nonomuraea angiospora]|uniref:TetR/AcrR family transcriptional regulator n=1 Tax=Nonomuraea angiospora TaxID=46172 RepID=UPI0033212709
MSVYPAGAAGRRSGPRRKPKRSDEPGGADDSAWFAAGNWRPVSALSVGIATLFRRFPVKEDLVAAVFADRREAYVDAVAAALADSDSWHGFTGCLHTVCAMQAADRGFADVLTMTFPTAKALEGRRSQAYDGVVSLIDRAKAAGHLRDDFTPQHVALLLMATAGVITATADAAPDAWRGILALMIQSFQTPARGPLPAPPAHPALYRAMINLGRAYSPFRASTRS